MAIQHVETRETQHTNQIAQHLINFPVSCSGLLTCGCCQCPGHSTERVPRGSDVHHLRSALPLAQRFDEGVLYSLTGYRSCSSNSKTVPGIAGRVDTCTVQCLSHGLHKLLSREEFSVRECGLLQIVETGQSSPTPNPRNTETPTRKGSILDILMCTSKTRRRFMQSTLTSPYERCTAGSNCVSDGTTTSPDRRNLKKHMDAAAHSIKASRWFNHVCRTRFRQSSISGVMGRWVRAGRLDVCLFSPLTYSSCDILSMPGSPNPRAISVCRNAAMFVALNHAGC